MNKPILPAWEHLGSRTLLEHSHCRIIEDHVRLGTGKEIAWWRFDDSGRDVVCVICVDDHQRVLIAYQYSHPAGQVVDEFPGGGVEQAETYSDAARRELLEETGMYAHHLEEIGAFLMNNRRSGTRCRVFLATNAEMRGTMPDEEEAVAIEWVPVNEVNARIRRGEIENSYLLAAWSIYAARSEERHAG